MTNLVELTGERQNMEKEVSDFTFLMEKREEMFKKLDELNESIAAFRSGDAETVAQCDEKRKEFQQIVSDIVKKDEANMKIMTEVMAAIKSSIKDVKNERAINNVYVNPYDHEQPTGYFDTKQ